MGEGKKAIDGQILIDDARKAGLDVRKLSADVLAPGTDQAIVAALKLAREAHFSGTPLFIVNGKVHEGEISAAELAQLTRR